MRESAEIWVGVRLTGEVSTDESLTVVVVEDDPAIAGLIAKTLEADGHVGPDLLHRSRRARRSCRDAAPDVVLLDLGLPDQDGSSVLRTLRGQTTRSAIICVTARADEIDRVLGFELGADDYVTKPFSPRELAGRVRALGRRVRREEQPAARRSGSATSWWTPLARRCAIGSDVVALTPIERDLTEYLARNRGLALSRLQILEAVWGHDWLGESRTVDVHVAQIRRKLGIGRRDHDGARRGVPARMSAAARPPRSIASRLRWSFLAVILAVTAIAAAVTIVLVRRANEDDTIEEARTTARAGARAVSVQVRSQLEGDEHERPVVARADRVAPALAGHPGRRDRAHQ